MLGQLANLRLAETALGQGTPHVLARRRLAGPGDTRRGRRDCCRRPPPPRPSRLATCSTCGEQFRLAMVAAVRPGWLDKREWTVRRSRPPRDGCRFAGPTPATSSNSPAGQAGALAGDGHGPVAQGQLGGLGQHRAVQTAGEGHGATAVAPQQIQQAVAFGGEIGGKIGSLQQSLQLAECVHVRFAPTGDCPQADG